jgi:putative membrane protein
MFYMRDVGWGWEFLMGVGMIVFWGVIVLGVIWLVRGGNGGSAAQNLPPAAVPAAPMETAKDILDRRLANGELSLEEYRERRAAMEHDCDTAGAPL